jgi:phosphoglucosamine mutase
MRLFGSSGIRAPFSGDLLTLAYRVGLAVGRGRRNVVVATDTRTSGDAMKHAVCAGLAASGARIADAGIVPTPTLAYVTREFEAGVMVTASHNPPEYNGVKLLNPDGSSFGPLQQAEVEESVAAAPQVADWEHLGQTVPFPSAAELHTARIRENFSEDDDLRVVVDAGCGAASLVTPGLLETLGCDVVTLNCYHSGFFPRPAEPAAANLQELCDTVRESGAALGIAHDGDADRMMAVDENGRFVTGDQLLAVFARSGGFHNVVTTLDASMAIDEMGLEVRRTRIGDTWVSDELRNGGDFGGETSGCWVFPKVSLCPDGIYAAARLVELVARTKLSELVDAVPAYPLLRASVPGRVASLEEVEAALAHLKPAATDRTDGIKLVFEDGWLLVRPSGTEPKVRLTAEARTGARAQRLMDAARSALKAAPAGRGARS